MIKFESMDKLLQVSHSLYKKQHELQRIFGEFCEVFKNDIQLIMDTLLNIMGLPKDGEEIVLKGMKRIYTRKGLYLSFEHFFEDTISQDELLQFILEYKVYLTEHDVKVIRMYRMDLLNTLLEIVFSIQTNKSKIESLVQTRTDFLNSEREILEKIVLNELGEQRYFQCS